MFESLYACIGIGVIFILGFSGAVVPSVLKIFFPKYGLTRKYYFSFFNGIACGVILAVALIHSLADATDAFSSVSSLQGDSLTDGYPWPMFVMLMAILILFTVEEVLEVLANRFGIVGFDAHGFMGTHGHAESTTKKEPGEKSCDHTTAEHKANDGECDAQPLEELCDHHHADDDSTSSSSDDEDVEHGKKAAASKSGDGSDSEEEEEPQGQKASGLNLMLKMIVVFVGLMLHNIFVGLTLGIADNDYVLFIALIFHQFFEGLGMGARVAMANVRHIIIVLAIDFTFALIPVLFIAIGIGIKNSISEAADSTDGYNIAKGTLQSLSAGVLVYVSIMHMLRSYKDTGVAGPEVDWHRLAAWCGLLFGCAVMAVIGIWA